VRVAVEPLPDATVEQVEAALLGALARNRPSSPLEPLHVSARDDDGALLAAMVGGVSYGWLHVEMLCVAEEHRSRGIGTRLMRCAEEAARSRGCHGAWLDTSSAAACVFYERLGYREFGRLENAGGEEPAGHRRWFLQKRLSASP
jgi:ribosomal protein S18 acetylase RimI-like enzyme